MEIGRVSGRKRRDLEWMIRERRTGWEEVAETEGRVPTDRQASTVNHFKQGFLHSQSEVVSMWHQLLKNEILFENNEKTKILHFNIKLAKQEFHMTATYLHLDVPRKTNVSAWILWADHKNLPLVLQFEAEIEEVKKEKLLYQKRGIVLFRHPFKLPIPQSFLIQETFTVNKKEKHYFLETKVLINELYESVQTLTFGYQVENPYVCAGLVLPYNIKILPQNVEVCARIRNLNHVQFPWSISMNGELFSEKSKMADFSQGLIINATVNQLDTSQFSIWLNGSNTGFGFYSQLLHLNHSKFLPCFQVHATTNQYGVNSLNGSFYLHSSGKDLVLLEADFNNEISKTTRAIRVSTVLRQAILTQFRDLWLHFMGKLSPSRFMLSSEIKLNQNTFHLSALGSKEQKAGLALTLHGSIQHNLHNLKSIIPQDLSMGGSLKWKKNIHEGTNFSKKLSVGMTTYVGEKKFSIELENGGIDSTARSSLFLHHNKPAQILLNGSVLSSNCAADRMEEVASNYTFAQLHIHTACSPPEHIVQINFRHFWPYLRSLGLAEENQIKVTTVKKDGYRGLLEVSFGECMLTSNAELTTDDGKTELPPNLAARGSFLKNIDKFTLTAYLQCDDKTADMKVKMSSIDKHTLQGTLNHSFPDLHDLGLPPENLILLSMTNGSALKAHLLLHMGNCKLQAQGEVQPHNRTNWVLEVETNCKALQTMMSFQSNAFQERWMQSMSAQALIMYALDSVDVDQEHETFCLSLHNGTVSYPNAINLSFSLKKLENKTQTAFQIQHNNRSLNGTIDVFTGFEIYGPFELRTEVKHSFSHLKHLGLPSSLTLILFEAISENKTEASIKLTGDPNLNLWFIFTIKNKCQSSEYTLSEYTEYHFLLQALHHAPSFHKANVEICHPFSIYFPHHSALNMYVEHSMRSHRDDIIIGWDTREQMQLAWNDGEPGHMKFTFGDKSKAHITLWDVCVTGSSGRLQNILGVMNFQACGFLKQTATLFNQHTDLKWDGKKIMQNLTYEKSKPLHLDKMQIEAILENVLLTSCSSQHLLGKLEMDYSAQLNHYMSLQACGLPSLRASEAIWLHMVGSVTSSDDESKVLVEGEIDSKKNVKIAASKGKGCLHYYIGHLKGNSEDGLELTACTDSQQYAALNTYLILNGERYEELGHLSMEASNHSLNLKAYGCQNPIDKAESKLNEILSDLQHRLVAKIKNVEEQLWNFRKQVQHIEFLYDAIGWPLKAYQEVTGILQTTMRGVIQMWKQSGIKEVIQVDLPLYLGKLQDLVQQMQMELQKPLTTLKDAYYDVTLKPLDEVWQQKTEEHLKKLQAFVPTVVKDVWLMKPIQVSLRMLKTGLDVVGI
ncbi:hypothetical protein JD844_019775 [Phrynosoma platyrhinos]|uniref:VWFD domain-containing protein n=1 Tax=Phrynosoma platyrhinos TaxID=52577 RepID=A0ABQ7TRD3_PHRPL|nr:hypothetical protein JD844_019775 [Phrynosoma platyrhinos]